MQSSLLRSRVLAMGSALSFVVGCSSIESGDLRTNGMQPQMVARSNSTDANSTMSVTIHVGNNPLQFVDLDAPDVLKLTVGDGEPAELQQQNLLGVVTYTGSITGKETGTAVAVALERGPEDEGAPSSTVTFTDPLTLTAPGAGAAFSRANDDIVVSWDTGASDDGVKVTFTGTCINGGERNVQPGETTVTLEAGSIQKRQAADEEDQDDIPDSCDLAISAVRTRTGELDPAFGGGGIRHEFSASATVTTNP